MMGSRLLPTVFLDADTIKPETLDISGLEGVAAPLTWHGNTASNQLLARTAGAECVITNKVKLDRSFFEQRPEVRLVCAFATGTDHIDLAAAETHKVAVTNCRGYSTDSVAQHTLMLLLMLLRSSQPYQRQVQKGDWSRSELFCLLNEPIRETAGLTLGVVGYGDIGQAVHRLAEAFGLRVLVSERVGCEPRNGRVAFEQVLEQSDILTLHCPLTAQTRGLLDASRFSTMKPGALLINTARGELLNESDLVTALNSRQLGGAAVDVLSAEPPPASHPLLNAQMPNLPNLIVTPHNAWASHRARQKAIGQTAENIHAWKEGKRLRRVI